MTITIILSVAMMVGLFLLLWAAVALIQNKKFFTSAPKEAQAVIQPKEERFPVHTHWGTLWRFLQFC